MNFCSPICFSESFVILTIVHWCRNDRGKEMLDLVRPLLDITPTVSSVRTIPPIHALHWVSFAVQLFFQINV